MEQLIILVLHKGNPSVLNSSEKNAFNPAHPERFGKVNIDTMYYEGPGDICSPWDHALGQDRYITAEHLDPIKFCRLFKSHFPVYLFVGMGEQRKALESRVALKFDKADVKIVYLIRDPKDVALSHLPLNSLNLEKHGFPFPAYAKLFLEGKVSAGHWGQHTKNWLEVAAQYPEAFLVVTYEDIKEDPEGTARKVANFLNIDLTEGQLQACLHYSSFEVIKDMSKNSHVEHIHKDTVGGWRKRMSPEIVEAFNEMVRKAGLGKYGKKYSQKLCE